MPTLSAAVSQSKYGVAFVQTPFAGATRLNGLGGVVSCAFAAKAHIHTPSTIATNDTDRFIIFSSPVLCDGVVYPAAL